ncbi:glycosyltransferase family 4 protein [Haloferula chungangensis]|uniref:Glycosyltransferase family 4 protein n=1 Tax=Haloferula chungangensis TaxID=1048331 RepID=A0ABW2LAM4_9BACT
MTESHSGLLLFCPSSFGGIADYAHHQAEALGRRGIPVLMLCPPDYPHRAVAYRQERCLPAGGKRSKLLLFRLMTPVWLLLGAYIILVRQIRERGCKRVLLASYGEYLAPLWAWRMRRLRRLGVRFGAVVHDPVRDFVLGPNWWHRWSISEGYSFLDAVFLHHPIELDTGVRKFDLEQTVIPHGPYFFPEANRSRVETRAALKIPQQAKVFLSFGHLRDGKNLDLILEALSTLPQAYLLVVGTEAGTGHVRSEDYQKQAERLGVDDRCRWKVGFASPEEVADYFEAADFALLTYEARFRSASGVLNVAARYRRPVVASCGESNLSTAVKNYQLGPWVEPDRADEIARGMREILDQGAAPEWERYLEENSWEKNAELVSRALDL